ncbi:Hypothetical Protein Arad_4981 [Rhizobium rhizogenes K84]|uniref:Uncharacterized protein n=1 Tax=Rhizobium rhizogenes (strain K84 / ATCC BAA-868) TaxID=311403 RepID=B9JGM5_RHIR8|nr:Hypothetical Protein Arad_4981 [Rhizobium rhizogenes K84]
MTINANTASVARCRFIGHEVIRYAREVTFRSPIVTDKYNGFQSTSTMTILIDRFGNLVTAIPGRVQ